MSVFRRFGSVSYRSNLWQKSLCPLIALHKLRMQSICNINTDGIDNTIITDFFSSVSLYPNRIATIYNGDCVTYSSLYSKVLQCTAYLHAHYSISSSDVIAICTSNRPEYFQLILSCHLLNCSIIPLNCSVSKDINIELINNTNVKLLIYEYELPFINDNNLNNISLLQLDSVFNNCISWIGENWNDNNNNNLENICSDIIYSSINNINYNLNDNICQYMSTSGTTGKPKLISHSFNNKIISTAQYETLFKYYANENISSGVPYDDGCRFLLTGSTFHVTTYNLLISSIRNGNCCVIPMISSSNSIINSAENLWKSIHIYKANVSCFLTASVYSLLKFNRSLNGNHLKTIYITGEIIPSELIKKFMKLLYDGNRTSNSDIRIVNFYGATECEIIGFSDYISIDKWDDDTLYAKLMKINQIAGINIKINNNEERELQINTSCLMKEYYQNPSKTDSVISVDSNNLKWYLTGEQITFLNDDNTSFRIDARRKDIFITFEGALCYPVIIENVLLKHDLISGCVVIGMTYNHIYNNDELPSVEHPIAFITVNDNTIRNDNDKENKLINELIILCENNLQRNMGEIPYKIFIVDDIPKTANGKILRDDLKNMAIKYFKQHNVTFDENILQ